MPGKDKVSARSLEKITELHAPEVPALNVYPNEIPRIYNSPEFDNLRSDPGYQAVIRKIGLSGHKAVN
jgi:hypothetical protein